jgi:hypothetical protein
MRGGPLSALEDPTLVTARPSPDGEAVVRLGLFAYNGSSSGIAPT